MDGLQDLDFHQKVAEEAEEGLTENIVEKQVVLSALKTKALAELEDIAWQRLDLNEN